MKKNKEQEIKLPGERKRAMLLPLDRLVGHLLCEVMFACRRTMPVISRCTRSMVIATPAIGYMRVINSLVCIWATLEPRQHSGWKQTLRTQSTNSRIDESLLSVPEHIEALRVCTSAKLYR